MTINVVTYIATDRVASAIAFIVHYIHAKKHWQKEYRNMDSKELTNHNCLSGTYPKINT